MLNHVSNNKKDTCFSYGFLKLAPGGVILDDNTWNINTLKPFSKLTAMPVDTSVYLPKEAKLAYRKETVVFRTALCSNKLTQDPGLAKLFNFKQHSLEELSQVLRFLDKNVTLNQLATLAKPIIDNLFIMLESQNLQALGPQLFDALTRVLSKLTDPKMKSLNHLVPEYIDSCLRPHNLSCKFLLNQMILHLQTFSENKMAKSDCYKVLQTYLNMVIEIHNNAQALQSAPEDTQMAQQLSLQLFEVVQDFCTRYVLNTFISQFQISNSLI